MNTASYTLCWRHQVSVVLICSSVEPQVSSYTQIAPVCLPFERVSFVWSVSWKLLDSIVDDMLTYSLKALHVGAHAACHMTANIQLMSCSRPRVVTHVLFESGDLRCDRNGLSVATHMDSEAPIRTVLTDQDDSRLGFVNLSPCLLGRVVKNRKSNTLLLNLTSKDKLFSKWTRC